MPTRARRPRPSQESQSEPGRDGGHQSARDVPPGPNDETAADVREALERARRHGRAAAAEALAAVRALLDAASLGASGEPSDSHAGLASLVRGLDELAASLGGDRSSPMLEAILDALDVEIRRWETRSAGDMEARAVLRAFLGVREILWEFGLRRSETGGAEPPGRQSEETDEPTPRRAARPAAKSRTRADPKSPRRSRRRVQRVEVEG